MTRTQARETLREIIDSGMLNDDVASELDDICDALCADEWDNCDGDDDRCIGCPYSENCDI